MYEITRVSIFLLIAIFAVYLGLHIFISTQLQSIEIELLNKPGNTTLETKRKHLALLNKWFPAIAVVLIIIGFYFM